MKKSQRAGELQELRGDHCAAAGGLGPRVEAVGDLPGRRDVVDLDELDPLDVPDDGDFISGPGGRSSSSAR